MAGYAAVMRIERIEIRSGVMARPLSVHRDAVEQPPGVAIVELAGIEPGARLWQRFDEVRVYFGQVTWYLFNAEGWR